MTKKAMNIQEMLRAAYLAGFGASCEGYNAEWPFGDHNENPENDPHWCMKRDLALSEMLGKENGIS